MEKNIPKTELELSSASKQMLNDISALFGVSRETVKEVWDYTALTWFRQLASNPKKMTTITVPYLGNIGIRFESNSIGEDEKIESNLVAFVSLSDDFKHNYYNLASTGSADLVLKFIGDNYIRTLFNR